ncbi:MULTISPECIES: amino acid adenylation domain-containing protein [unclassified Nonomuraea]|uniref:amino acid adenylation domain-containing protein n=1 Tax=unclassified Nonomuraea TaxID=2593643 RepID=UPI0033EC4568
MTDDAKGPGAGTRVHEAISIQTRKSPDSVAVIAGATRLTYAELDRRANGVAHTLLNRGIGRGHHVGICLEQGEWLLPALLGVWKAGAAYVPLDPAHPAERLRFMDANAEVTAVLSTTAPAARATLTGAQVVHVDDVAPREDAPGVAGDAADAAYVIYTSGSTGTPKGVVVEHRNTMNFLAWGASAYTAEELGGMLAGASICFDASIMLLFVPLVAGGTVIMAENLLALPSLPARDEVTTVFGVPSALSVLLRDPLPPGVRTVVSGGEPLTAALIRQIYANPNVRRVLNMYGPTECSTACTFFEAGRDFDGEPPLGEPLAGAVLSVRDAQGLPVQDGELGELWIGGPVVARGYLGVGSPAFGSGPDGGRVYRSGDLVRRVDGELRYAGRADDQVKIRGIRVELGEVEAVLGGHPAVRRAVVLAQTGDDGAAHLVGHVAATEERGERARAARVAARPAARPPGPGPDRDQREPAAGPHRQGRPRGPAHARLHAAGRRAAGRASTFRDLVRQAADATTRALIHQEIPPAELPRTAVLLAMQHSEVPLRVEGLELLTELGSGAAGHELSVLVNRTASGGELHLEYATALLDRDRAEAYVDRLIALLRHAMTDPGRELELVTPDERAALLALAAGPDLPRPLPTVPRSIASHTTGTAVVGPDGTSLSFADLNDWADRAAATLLEHGVAPGDVVGVCLPRDHLMPAVLLAVWRAGAAYLPMDPEHPAERLRLLAEDAGARVVLARGDVPGLAVLDLDRLALDGRAELPEVRPGDLAYVMYTSGSTGTPKGVEVTHANLAALVAGTAAALRLGPDDVQPAVAPLTFDAAASELWTVLTCGGTSVVVDRATARDGHALAEAAAKATVLDLVPTAYRMLIEAGWTGDAELRAVTGGEALDPGLAAEILARAGELWNAYGPTEATVTSTMHRVSVAEPSPVPIGSPMPGERAYVVDPRLRLLPPGTVGELLLGGAGVARGYRNRPGLSGFVDDPFVPGGRCTGRGTSRTGGPTGRWSSTAAATTR